MIETLAAEFLPHWYLLHSCVAVTLNAPYVKMPSWTVASTSNTQFWCLPAGRCLCVFFTSKSLFSRLLKKKQVRSQSPQIFQYLLLFTDGWVLGLVLNRLLFLFSFLFKTLHALLISSASVLSPTELSALVALTQSVQDHPPLPFSRWIKTHKTVFLCKTTLTCPAAVFGKNRIFIYIYYSIL